MKPEPKVSPERSPLTHEGTYAIWPVVIGCCALTLFFFAPRLWLLWTETPGTYEWDRARTFLLQCADPFRRDVEPAMRWRLLPPLIAHVAHLPGRVPLAIPWLGAVGLVWYVAKLFRAEGCGRRCVFGAALLVATTSAFLVPSEWLGINDAWVWLALLAVAFSRSSIAVAAGCLLGPWVDERFLIGLPIATIIRSRDRSVPLITVLLQVGLASAPYVVARSALTMAYRTEFASAADFLRAQPSSTRSISALIPLGWWMGLRIAWIGAAIAIWNPRGKPRLILALTSVATIAIMTTRASDLSRSIAILLPLVVLGCIEIGRRWPAEASRILLGLGIGNLLVPAAHVVHLSVVPINPLPLECLRLILH